jgi:hypothetical protein
MVAVVLMSLFDNDVSYSGEPSPKQWKLLYLAIVNHIHERYFPIIPNQSTTSCSQRV